MGAALADDLVLTAESEEEVIHMFNRWKEMDQRGLKINMEKTKLIVIGNKARDKIHLGRCPCGCCGRGVGANSILCSECDKQCHRRCP